MRTVPKSEAEAIALQLELRKQVATHAGLATEPRLVTGVDVAYAEGSDAVAAAAVVLDLNDLSVVETATATGRANFPYIPGLLAFREIPVLVEALEKLHNHPGVLVCDGYGIAHPRRFGLASHLGVLTGIPAFGVGKTAFIGTYSEVGQQRGAWSDLVDGEEVIGRVLRTQTGIKPVFVSPGHLIDIADSARLTLRLTPKFRLPETTRRADRLSRDALQAAL